MDDRRSMGSFDIAEIAASLPEHATTLLVDRYLTDRPSASARVFRVYRPTPPHYHAQCDEYLYVFSGRGTFWMGDASTKAEFGPGELLPAQLDARTRPCNLVGLLPRLGNAE